MDVHTNIPLKQYTTMQLGGPARFMVDIRTVDDVIQAHTNAVAQNLKIFILGGGSNTIVRDEGFPGIVFRIRIPGFAVVAETLYDTTITVGAGELWDDVVARTVEMGLSGIEAMSGIPGTAGAAPVQNIGAYGQELSDTLMELQAYDTENDTLVTLKNDECEFSYRHSIFRGRESGRYIITSITLSLSKSPLAPPFYASLQAYFDEHDITLYGSRTIRDAVLAIRTHKLPDPKRLPNAGSFFKSAIIEAWLRNDLLEDYPAMPSYDMGDGTYKIPTGWLIEQAGLKGKLLHGMRVYESHALVLVNESAAGYQDLDQARTDIIDRVRDTFRIMIEQEPLEL